MEHTDTARPANRKGASPDTINTTSVAAAFATARAVSKAPTRRRSNPRQARRFPGADGTPMVANPLPNGGLAIIEAEDFDTFVKLGLSTQWFLDDNGSGNLIVRFKLPSLDPRKRANNASVARIILNVIGGQRVRYRDKNPLNLTRANLYLADGYSKGREAAVLRSLENGVEF